MPLPPLWHCDKCGRETSVDVKPALRRLEHEIGIGIDACNNTWFWRCTCGEGGQRIRSELAAQFAAGWHSNNWREQHDSQA